MGNQISYPLSVLSVRGSGGLLLQYLSARYPSQFTHQGAQWMKPMYQPLRNVPWPCDESNLQAALDSIVHQGWTGRLAGADKAARSSSRTW